MMCQTIGFPPISTIGLGRTSVSSVSRVPSPPARMPTFIGPSYRSCREMMRRPRVLGRAATRRSSCPPDTDARAASAQPTAGTAIPDPRAHDGGAGRLRSGQVVEPRPDPDHHRGHRVFRPSLPSTAPAWGRRAPTHRMWGRPARSRPRSSSRSHVLMAIRTAASRRRPPASREPAPEAPAAQPPRRREHRRRRSAARRIEAGCGDRGMYSMPVTFSVPRCRDVGGSTRGACRRAPRGRPNPPRLAVRGTL